MDRAEATGTGVALVAHVLLLGILSTALVSTSRPLPVLNPPMDVQLVDETGLKSAAPEIAQEAPQTSQAPETGKPEEAAPEPTPTPEPEPVPAPPPPTPRPEPTPKPTPPQPAKPTPASPKPTPAKPTPKPQPAPKPAPKPTPKPTPAPPAAAAPAKTKPAAKPSPPAASKPSKAAGSGSSPAAKPAARPAGAANTAKPATNAGKGAKGDTRAAVASDDFLKGITPEKSPGKAKAPRAQQVSALAMNGLAAAIKRQIQPCYDLGSLGGTPAMKIVTTLDLRFNKDGSVAGTPKVVEQTGVDGANRSYAQQMAEVGRRAVIRCAPLKLPPELYEGGWDELNFRFTPGQMQ